MHVSQLQKYFHDPSHMLTSEHLQLDENLSYEERPLKIMDKRDKVLRNQTIPLVEVLWTNHRVEEATWERELNMRKRFPQLF